MNRLKKATYVRFKRLLRAAGGNDILDKIKIGMSEIISWFPVFIKKRYPLIGEKIDDLRNFIAARSVISLFGSRFKLYDAESIYFLEPSFEPWMHLVLQPTDDEIFLDVGANIGRYTILLASRMPKGKVIAVEANPFVFKILLENIKKNGIQNVVPLNIGAWSEESMLKFYISALGGRSTFKKAMINEKVKSIINIPVRPLDKVLSQLCLDNLHYVKIDVEGAEVEVIQGLLEHISKFHPLIVAEVKPENEQKMMNLLRPLGYESNYIPESGQYFVYSYQRK